MTGQSFRYLAIIVTVVLVCVINISAQEMETKAVAGGGISVPGWTGQVDAREKTAGMTLNSAKFVSEGKGFHITTGPAITYWNPADMAKGDYTVSATF
jgi:hypothetical protein